jgi:hypothetical protein
VSDPAETARILRLTRDSHLALLLEMEERLSRLRANKFQARVLMNEARRIRAGLPVPPSELCQQCREYRTQTYVDKCLHDNCTLPEGSKK